MCKVFKVVSLPEWFRQSERAHCNLVESCSELRQPRSCKSGPDLAWSCTSMTGLRSYGSSSCLKRFPAAKSSKLQIRTCLYLSNCHGTVYIYQSSPLITYCAILPVFALSLHWLPLKHWYWCVSRSPSMWCRWQRLTGFHWIYLMLIICVTIKSWQWCRHRHRHVHPIHRIFIRASCHCTALLMALASTENWPRKFSFSSEFGNTLSMESY